jgi:hypothetical protein
MYTSYAPHLTETALGRDQLVKKMNESSLIEEVVVRPYGNYTVVIGYSSASVYRLKYEYSAGLPLTPEAVYAEMNVSELVEPKVEAPAEELVGA